MLNELLYQSLETELGGEKVYEAALKCTINRDAREEWQKYLDETRHHQDVLMSVFQALGLNPEAESPGRMVVRAKAAGLVKAMEMALAQGPKEGAELCAAESIVEAETKDHQNWELIGRVAKDMKGTTEGTALKAAHDEVEDQEDMHLYHTMGWARELWIQALGMPAVLPPPEEKKKVTSMKAAATAVETRKAPAAPAKKR
ncbi:MAG: hypothetical protein ACR2HN_13070 [Tepidiformaceae bacterium]